MLIHNSSALILCIFALSATCLAQVNPASSDLSVANIRKALADDRAAIAAHPKDPANYINLAYVLTDAGMGEQARTAVAEATRVAPTSAFAFNAQGWVLRHNLIGIDFGSGLDFEGALDSYRKAVELDPKDLDVRESLANLLEYSPDGLHYGPKAQLSLAVEAYRYVQQHQRTITSDVADNLAIDLFYAERYEDAIKEVTSFIGSDKRLGVLLASAAALRGSSVAIGMSNQIEGSEQRRKDALTLAAEGLWNKRRYAEAADLLTASLPDTRGDSSISAKIQIFRNLKPFSPTNLPASDPRRPVERLMELLLTGMLDQASIRELVSIHSYISEASQKEDFHEINAFEGIIFALMTQTQLPRPVIADIVLGRMTVTVPPDAKLLAPVRVQIVGIPPAQFVVVFEDGTWKIAVTGLGSNSGAGDQAYYLIQKGELEAAQSILDLCYLAQRRSREENDPLGGTLFSHLWSPKMRPAQNAATFASAALTKQDSLLRPLLPQIIKTREDAKDSEIQDSLDLLLANTYLQLRDVSNARSVIFKLLAKYPQSITALHLAARSYELEHDWAAWRELLTKRLKSDPDDSRLLRESATEAAVEGDYARAAQDYKRIVAGAQVAPDDYTTYAWLALFEANPEPAAFDAAEQATTNKSSRNYQSLLAAACLSAVRGDTAQAHQQLLDAMSEAHLSSPDAGIWYGFGQVFEKYGAADAAKSAYHRAIQMAQAQNPADLQAGGPSTSILAQMALKQLDTK